MDADQTATTKLNFSEATISKAVCSPERLEAVKRTGLLDSDPEESFDRLTRLAAKLVGAPVTFISLVDEHRDFYKSAFGFGGALANTRQLEGRTFCQYSIVAEGPLVLEDVTASTVFRNVPTIESLGVKAYAGIPLLSPEGQPIGSFCAIDFKPRHWSALDIEILTELSCSAMREIHVHLALKALSETNRYLEEKTRDLSEANEKLARLASTDALTGLRNRRAFEIALKIELARLARESSSVTLMLIDIDHFKRINDQFGHPEGDVVLRTIAQVLLDNVREVDMAARLGGEEFAVILPSTDKPGAWVLAERIRQAVESESPRGLTVTVSIGTATVSHDCPVTELLKIADKALYDSKRHGRNCVTQS